MFSYQPPLPLSPLQDIDSIRACDEKVTSLTNKYPYTQTQE